MFSGKPHTLQNAVSHAKTDWVIIDCLPSLPEAAPALLLSNLGRAMFKRSFMDSTDYVWEKLYSAVSTLVGADPIQDRLYDAFTSSLLVLTQDDFPNDLQPDFAFVEDALTRVDAVADEGSARSSADALSNAEAAEVAAKIFALFVGIIEHQANTEKSQEDEDEVE